MTKQIKTYYAQGPYISETKDNILFNENATEVILKSDHDEFCKQAQEKTDEDIKIMSDKIIGLEKNQKKLVEALRYVCRVTYGTEACNSKEVNNEILAQHFFNSADVASKALKEIGEN